MNRLFWLLTGGRPMRREGLAFVDRVSDESVCYYRDRLGRCWLATGAWSLTYGDVKVILDRIGGYTFDVEDSPRISCVHPVYGQLSLYNRQDRPMWPRFVRAASKHLIAVKQLGGL